MIKTLRKGFTIVELVIVIAVIAILAGVLIPTFSGVVGKANQSAQQQEFTNTLKVVLAGNAETGALSSDTRFVLSSSNKPTAYCDYNGNKLGSIEQADKANYSPIGLYNTDKKFTAVIIGVGTLSSTDETHLSALDSHAVAALGEIYGAAASYADNKITLGSSSQVVLTVYTNSDLSSGTFVLIP